jgi:enediyne biosynthesis protein E4
MPLPSWVKISLAALGGALLATWLVSAKCAQEQQPIQFTNVTAAAGIHFTHYKGNNGISINLEEFGPGVCVADYDGDGWQDIYFVNARDLYGRGIKVQNALYHNNGDGTFTDVTDKAGVPGTGFGLGCVWGDYDNDGHPDLFVTQYGRNVLYHNNGDGTFTDVTDKAGVAGMDYGAYFHSGATFFDYDRDGKLDLYVGSYVAFPPGAQRYCKLAGVTTSSCPPSAYAGSPSILYHNNGDGTFTNVTKKAGVYQPNCKTLAVGAADYDNDGWPDLFVANDGIEAYLYHNEHNGTFKEEGSTSGMAYTGQGLTMAAMCISLGDYNNDGLLDLYISDFQGSSDHVWKNGGQGLFDEVSDRAGITLPTRNVLSFGGGFFDYDNDGWLDLFIANGHVYPEIEQVTTVHYKQINSLFHNDGHGKFVDVTKISGDGFSTPHVGRGVGFADFDNDGFMDVVVANNNDPPLLLHNSGGNGNHFVSFKLIGTKSNRDAMGARLKLTAGGLTQIREVEGGGSYMSQSDLRAHFGLGAATKIDKLEISWPSGAKQTFTNFAADQFYSILEGTDTLGYQPFVKAGRNKTAAAEATKVAAHPGDKSQ